MTGGVEGAIRQIGIFAWRNVRLMPPVQRMTPLKPPLHWWEWRFGGCAGDCRRTLRCIDPIAEGALGDLRIAGGFCNIPFKDFGVDAENEVFMSTRVFAH